VRLVDLELPETAATRAAGEVLDRYVSDALANHAMRSAAFAAAYGRLTGVDYDPELLHVAGLLHDLGLEPAFDNHRLPFEDAGGELAWVFGAGLGWPAWRRQRLADVIARHMWDHVDPSFDPEGHLLERATSLDISGRGVGRVAGAAAGRRARRPGRGSTWPSGSPRASPTRPPASRTAPRPRRCARVWVSASPRTR
jgi:hypothetical protein